MTEVGKIWPYFAAASENGVPLWTLKIILFKSVLISDPSALSTISSSAVDRVTPERSIKAILLKISAWSDLFSLFRKRKPPSPAKKERRDPSFFTYKVRLPSLSRCEMADMRSLYGSLVVPEETSPEGAISLYLK